jgi:hypothetical protein
MNHTLQNNFANNNRTNHSNKQNISHDVTLNCFKCWYFEFAGSAHEQCRDVCLTDFDVKRK